MKLENQVVSLELSKKLKELGVKQESLFYWSDADVYTEEKGWTVNYRSKITKRDGVELDWYSAYTVAELGEMLPHSVRTDARLSTLRACTSEDKRTHGITGYTIDGQVTIEMICATTEADARAKMLIYLLENKLITL